MRQRFVYGVQTMSMTGPDNLEAASEPVSNDGKRLLSPGQSEEAAVCSSTVPFPSSLTTFLSRSDLVPFILELEKSLLVSKEHDYAKAPDRVAVLQATTVLERTAESTTNSCGQRTDAGARAEPLNELLNCCGELARLRSGLLRSDENVTSRHLREVVSLQAALVREQQEQLYSKDRELATVRKDRDQLEARLERMERRLAVHQKRNSTAHNTPDTDSHATPTTPSSLSISRRHSRTESLILSERIPQSSRSRSSSLERSRSRLRPSSQSATTPTPLDDGTGGKRSARKRLRPEDANTVTTTTVDSPTQLKRVRKTPKLTEIRTKLAYDGLDLLPVHSIEALSDEATNHTDSPTTEKSSGGCCLDKTHQPNGALSESTVFCRDKTIVVPSWRLHPLETLDEQSNNSEDISDDTFLRRHKKHEEDEKRRKRWDLQRARALLEHQELLKKYNKKSGGGEQVQEKKDKTASLLPKLEDIEEIEVFPTVAVSAFGHLIPQLKKSEFELPWFDLDVREARENVRTTRSKARATRTSAGSSDDL